VNNINDQLDATIKIVLIFESSQHVSGNHMPIFRNVRLVYTNVVYFPNVVLGWRPGVWRRRLCVRCGGCRSIICSLTSMMHGQTQIIFRYCVFEHAMLASFLLYYI
jgi:hypothetical protein